STEAAASVEIVIQHLPVNLIIVPVIVSKPIHRPHDTGAMSPTSTMHKKGAGRRVVGKFKKGVDLLWSWIPFVFHRNIDVTHAGGLDGCAFVGHGLVAQINHGLDAQIG